MQVYHEAGKVVWYSHLFKNFPQYFVIHTVKGFGLVTETEVYAFLFSPEFPLIFLWSNECITRNKVSGGDGIPTELS